MSDVWRRRIAALLLVVGGRSAALAIADVGPSDDPPTPEEEVSEVVEDFYGAAADGDFVTRACRPSRRTVSCERTRRS